MSKRLSCLLVAGLTAAWFAHAGAAESSRQQAAANSAAPASASTGNAAQLVAKGRLDEALAELDRLAASQPEAAGVERMRGFVLYQQNKLPESEAAFAKALAQDANDREAAQMRGVALFRLGRPQEALPFLEKARLAVSRANVDPNYLLGLCYLDLRRMDDARAAFAAEYGFAPESAEAHLLLGRMLFRKERMVAAQESVQKALAVNSKLPLAHQLLGEIALAHGDLAAATAELEKERATNPLFPGVYDRLGDAYTRAGDYQKAQDALNRAVLLDPNATGPYIQLGKVLLKQENPVMATMYLERAREMDPSNAMTHVLLAQAYRATGRKDDSTREFEAAQKIHHGNLPQGVN